MQLMRQIAEVVGNRGRGLPDVLYRCSPFCGRRRVIFAAKIAKRQKQLVRKEALVTISLALWLRSLTESHRRLHSWCVTTRSITAARLV